MCVVNGVVRMKCGECGGVCEMDEEGVMLNNFCVCEEQKSVVCRECGEEVSF